MKARGVVLTVVSFLASFFILNAILIGVIRNNGSFHTALAFINSNEVLKTNCGEILETKLPFWSGGKISEHGDSGTASLVILVQGIHGRGKVYTDLKKTEGVWNVIGAK